MPLLPASGLDSSPFAEQPPCRNWLSSRFPSNRLATAALLLNSLRLVSHNEFERSLTRLIVKAASQARGKVALYCAWDVPSGESYFPADPSCAPNRLRLGEEIGSEGRIAHIIRNIAREFPNTFLDHPSVEEMRRTRCHELFIIDDSIGSGETIIHFAAALARERHLKSWISGRLVHFTVIAFSVSQRGEKSIRAKLRGLQDIKFECRPTGGSAWWSPERRLAVLDLCKTFGQRTKYPDASYGYKGSFGLIVFEHGCPDNAPAILWATSERWPALFKHRSIPHEIAAYFDPRDSPLDTQQSLALLGQSVLAGSPWIKKAGPEARNIILILAAISKKLRKTTRMSEYTGLPISECERLINMGLQFGLLTPGPYLTPLGLAELRRLKHSEREQQKLADAEEPVYYPHSLRGLGEI